MAKASREDLDAMYKFMQMAELTMEHRRFGFSSPEEEWLHLDDEDGDKVRMTRIRKDIADELGYNEEDVDSRLVIYEYLKELYEAASGWGRVVMGMDILLEHACDPQKDYLDYAPGLQQFHVAPES
jgi:hypothetical protein